MNFTPQNKMLVVHWNGSSWRTVATPAAPVRRGDHAVPIQFVAAGANNLWLTTNIVDNNGVLPGQSLVLHRDGSGWHWIRVPFSDQALNAAPDGHGGLWANALTNSPSTVYDFVHYSGGKWTRQSAPSAGIPPVVGTEDVFYLALIPGTQMLWASGDAFWDTPTTSASASVMFKYVP